MTKQRRQNICYTNPTQKSIKDLNFKLTVGRSSSRVSRHGRSETESELTELTIYISMADYFLADSVNFCLFPELFLFPVLPIYYSRNYSRTIGSGLAGFNTEALCQGSGAPSQKHLICRTPFVRVFSFEIHSLHTSFQSTLFVPSPLHTGNCTSWSEIITMTIRC